MSPSRETGTEAPEPGSSLSKAPCALRCLNAPRHLDAEGSGSPAGRQGGSWPPFSLLHTLRPDLPVSQEEMRPVPVPSQVSRAQLELQVIGSCRAPYSSLRTGAGSAAFTCPIKHCSLPMQCMAPSGDLSLPGQRGRVSSLRNQSPKLIKSLEMPWGGLCPER